MAGEGVSIGVNSKVLFEPAASPHVFDASSERYEYHSETLAFHGRMVGGSGIRGTRSSPVERVRKAAGYVFGDIVMDISPGDFVNLLPKILGNNEAPAGTFNLTEDTPYFGTLIETTGDVFEFKDCKVNRAILQGRAPQFGEEGEPDLLRLTLQIFAKNHVNTTAWPGSEPALPTTANAAPYLFSDVTATVESVARELEMFTLVIDNHQMVKYVNSLTAGYIVPTDRTIMVRMGLPWNATNAAALYDLAANTGNTATLVLTNAGMSTTFTFGRLTIPATTPFVRSKRDQIMLILDGTARMVSTTRELVVVNDAVP